MTSLEWEYARDIKICVLWFCNHYVYEKELSHVWQLKNFVVSRDNFHWYFARRQAIYIKTICSLIITGHWFQVDLDFKEDNRSAIKAEVWLTGFTQKEISESNWIICLIDFGHLIFSIVFKREIINVNFFLWLKVMLINFSGQRRNFFWNKIPQN